MGLECGTWVAIFIDWMAQPLKDLMVPKNGSFMANFIEWMVRLGNSPMELNFGV